jgi:Na+/H+-translocating membrane pyrophosphatase
MSADLFGSFAESTCAALVISSNSLIGNAGSCNFMISNFMYPLMIIALGIFFCIFVSMLSTHIMSVDHQNQV